jgi:hypothetical protein
MRQVLYQLCSADMENRHREPYLAQLSARDGLKNNKPPKPWDFCNNKNSIQQMLLAI